jgi:proteasome accessory factor C
MVKQSAPIQEVARLLDLVPFLSTHSHISLKELASEFGVSEKEMAQELTSLSMCGLPGYTPYELIEVFFDSGFVTINNHDPLDLPRALTNIEISSLLIGLSMMSESSTGDVKLHGAIEDLKAKLSQLLNSESQVHVNPPSAEVTDIQRAIAERRLLRFTYLSPATVALDDREVEPYDLTTDQGKLYLRAYCRRAEALRLFRVDRMRNMTLGDSFIPQEREIDETSDRAFRSELRVMGRKRSIAEALSVDSISPAGALTYDSFSQEWVVRAVVAFSPDLILESPIDAKARVKSALEKTLDLYRS